MLTVESSGGSRRSGVRNPDYTILLEELLRRLGSLDACVMDAFVVSKRLAALPPEARRIAVRGRPFPIALREIRDFADLRRGFTRPQADIGSVREAAGGNRRKRIALHVSLPDSTPRTALLSVLGASEGRNTESTAGVIEGLHSADIEAALNRWRSDGREAFLTALNVRAGKRFVIAHDEVEADAFALLAGARALARLPGTAPWPEGKMSVADPLRAMGFAVDDLSNPEEGPLGGSPHEYENLLNKLGGSTDVAIRRLGRREQRFLRGSLGIASADPHATSQCDLCARVLPQSLLVAAHIKPRHRCSDAERLDMPHVGWVLCLLGCDALFERGLLAIAHDGRVLSRPFRDRPTPDLIAHLTALEGSMAPGWTSPRASYFEVHRRLHGVPG